jgi:hypothetical protein
MKRYLIPLIATVVFSPSLIWSTAAQSKYAAKSAVPVPASQATSPCEAGGAPSMSLREARDAFIKQGLKVRAQGEVCKPQDWIGGIMILTSMKSWLYVTKVEFRKDFNTSILAMARLEGYLPDRTFVREDSTQKLPSSFRVVNDLVGVGPVQIMLGGQLQKVRSIRYSISSMGVVLLTQSCDWCEVIEEPPDDGMGGGAPCQMVASGNCAGWGCTSSCRAVVGDPCDCSGFGFCYQIGGGTCKGTCPELKRCIMVAPNPGQFFCACVT